MKIDDLCNNTGEWLKGEGPSCDIVMSSRVRLARNLAPYKFPTHSSDDEKHEIIKIISNAISDYDIDKNLEIIELEETSGLDRRFLVERHLISVELEEGSGPRAIALNKDESLGIMINEEDHLRLQALQSGLQLENAYESISKIDDHISEHVQYAFDNEFGYLTSCPTNVGTGLRASVMVHLPALVMTKHIEKAFRAISKLNLAVRGLYGEGTEAHGDFFQISNQITIGCSEEDILGDLRAVIDQVVMYEKNARLRLMESEAIKLEDRIWRSYAILRNARIISSEEAMTHLSSVRMGMAMGLIKNMDIHILNELFVCCQPAHLQKYAGKALAATERDILRARLIRENMKDEKI